MRSLRSSRLGGCGFLVCAGLGGLAPVLLAGLAPLAADAACNPSCEKTFDCGSRFCDGVACVSVFEPAGTTCRAAVDVCDRAETCDGRSFGCPADAKRPSSAVCRSAVDACDGVEHCDGVSNACPADVGLAPAISRVTLLDHEHRFDGRFNKERDFSVELRGANLCSATVETPNFGSIQLVGTGEPSDRLAVSRVYYTSQTVSAPASGTYTLHVNRDAAAGGLSYSAGSPNGFVDVLSPATLATLPSSPTFSISNGCSNCAVIRAEVADGNTRQLVEETPDSYAPPLQTPVDLALADFLGPAALPDGPYRLAVEAIDGAVVADQTLAGDSSGQHFAYLFGTGDRNAILFSTPEAVVQNARVQFRGLGQLPNGTSSRAAGVSADGTVVVGSGQVGADQLAARWTEAEGLVSLGDLDGGQVFSEASAVSGDGSVVVGESNGSITEPFGDQAFRWTSATGMEALPPVAGGDSSAIGISRDGSTIVGWNYFSAQASSAFRWTEASGITPIAKLDIAYAASADGSIVAGNDRTDARLSTPGGPQLIGHLGDDNNGQAAAMTPDGGVVVGQSFKTTSDFLGGEPFLWTPARGIVGLGYRSIAFNKAFAVSDDGRVIVGSLDAGSSAALRAFLWTPERGIRRLGDVLLEDYGVTLPGWTLFAATGVSADGRTIVGNGEGPSGPEAWMLTVPEPTATAAGAAALGAVVGLARPPRRRSGVS